MIYFLQSGDDGNIKIGFTDDEAAVRMKPLQTGNDRYLKLLGTMPGTRDDEDTLHRRFAAHRVIEGGKEWFKPVPELMAIIPSSGLPSCGKVEVVEQFVSIKVMTVGRKQFSGKLLEQLPRREAIDWFELLIHLDDDIQPDTTIPTFLQSFDLSRHVNGNVWGWIKCDNDINGLPRRLLIWVSQGKLFKCSDHSVICGDMIPSLEVPKGTYGGINTRHPNYAKNERLRKIAEAIYPLRRKLPGWRDEDQLFYGV